MKKFTFICMMILVLLESNTLVPAACIDRQNNKPYYAETVITDVSVPNYTENTSAKNTDKTITKTKTTRFRNDNGMVAWEVSITATFSYNGTTSRCISCSHKTATYLSGWSIKSASSSKRGNTATATATAVYTSGSTSHSYTESVTIKCDKNGNVS